MKNQVTSEEVATQFAKAIQLLLEWAQQERLAPSQIRGVRAALFHESPDDQSSDGPERLLKPAEVSEMLQISRSQAYHLMQTGEIPSIRVGRAVRVRRSDLEGYIKKGVVAVDSPRQ